MAKDNTIRDSYIEKFIEEHSGSKVMKLESPIHEAFHGYHEEQIVYDDVMCALSDRLQGNESGFYLPEGLSLDGRESKNMLISDKNFRGSWTLKQPLDKNGKIFGMHSNIGYGRVTLFANRYSKDRHEELRENLTYEGVCAYMALGFSSTILEDRDFLHEEIVRIAGEEMQNEVSIAGDTQYDSVEKINEIKDKYEGLGYILDGLCEGFVYHQNQEMLRQKVLEEEKQMKVDEAQCAYNEAMKSLAGESYVQGDELAQ